MAPDDPPVLSRRALRHSGYADAVTSTLDAGQAPPPESSTTEVAAGEQIAEGTTTAPVSAPVRTALTWVDATTVARPRTGTADPDAGAFADEPDLLGRPPRRSPFRAGVLVPTALVMLVVGSYAATTLLWPLHEVAPTVEGIAVQPIAAPAATPPWPEIGSAAISVAGIPGELASTPDAATIASITKVVTALVVLEEMPLDLGEQGPEFRFSYADSVQYWQYRARGESALDVPVGGALTQYQMLEGVLIGSANNYADRLAGNLWPTDAVYAAAANDWLQAHGVPGIQVVEPTGLDSRNIATPAALLVLAQKALANPVIAEIVAKPAVELPGAGLVENTNGLLADPGVVGIKTGTLDSWNLLSAKNLTIGDSIVRVYASVLGQPDDESRLAVSRALYAQLEVELQPQTAVEAGTTVGYVTTAWGEDVAIVTSTDAALILWNGAVPETTSEFSLGGSRAEGADVGTVTLVAPLGHTTVDVRLAAEIEDPSPWWRLTHPLELFGLTD